MLTNYDSVETVKSVKHWDKKENTYVDLLGAFLSYYHIHVRITGYCGTFLIYPLFKDGFYKKGSLKMKQ